MNLPPVDGVDFYVNDKILFKAEIGETNGQVAVSLKNRLQILRSNFMAENEAEAQVEETVTDKAGLDNLKVLENIEVKLTVEVGSTELKIRDLLRLNEGSVVELDRLAGDPLDILANGVKIAKGEVVMVGERFGIRFTEVTNPENRVQKL